MPSFSPRAYRLGLYCLAGLLFSAWIIAWAMRPPVQPHLADPLNEIEAAPPPAQLEPENPLRLHVDVNYAEGESAAWYPKNESPILEPLVEQGLLPPVEERVGPEPIVYRGYESVGQYGGTWTTPVTNYLQLDVDFRFKQAMTLVRWSPQGYPIVPHVAKSFEVSDDYRTYTFHLRRGMRWSDGHPFTADDILYWWDSVNNEHLADLFPNMMRVGAEKGTVEKIDGHTVVFRFPNPHGLFLELLAGREGVPIAARPKHYLSQYHPDPAIGDPKLIADELAARRLGSPLDLYRKLIEFNNVEIPRLGPYLLRTYRPNPPLTLVRNPYFCMVDEQGNQLPYVDQKLVVQINSDLRSASVATGRYPFSINKPEDITLLMNLSLDEAFRAIRWFRADRSDAMIHLNLNRRIEPDDPSTAWKNRILNDQRFRRALSVAINRKDIIRLAYHGETEPAQVAPGPNSYFHHPEALKANIEYNPALANQLLDEAGLTNRDFDGYRQAPDGTPLTFLLGVPQWMNPVISQLIVEDWSAVGVRVVPRTRDSRLFYAEKTALRHDMTMWTGEAELIPTLYPRVYLPVSEESNFALGYARWFERGGMWGDPDAEGEGRIPVPEDHPLYYALELYNELRATGDREKQRELMSEIISIAAENVWTIGISTSPDYIVLARDDFRNVPHNVAASFTFLNPGNAAPETWYFRDATYDPEVVAEMQREILNPTPAPETLASKETEATSGGGSWSILGRIAQLLLFACLLGFALLLAIRHPFVGRRLLLMVPTMLIISVITFVIIEIPPGDYLTSRIMELEMQGDSVDMQEIEELREAFHLDDPMIVRYARWLGLYWFASFDAADEGLLQGNLGRSMEYYREVNQLVGDRILLTFSISLGTILFTWAFAIPVGILSAVRQYSAIDTFFTLLSFIGMCIPSFLLALVFMYWSNEYLGLPVDRLFSDKYALQPYWDIPKVLDLLKHIWVPVLILGIGGTGAMVRVMRGNLLDELGKPYVTTARAKGVRPLKLLFKYPVRLALNPFVSGIGAIFPTLISGGALVAIVLSLPTIGPMMLQAMLNEDTMLAGSLLVVLSLLGVLGVLVSDLLLMWLDPRIRMEGGRSR